MVHGLHVVIYLHAIPVSFLHYSLTSSLPSDIAQHRNEEITQEPFEAIVVSSFSTN
jgi:hypothetical protein